MSKIVEFYQKIDYNSLILTGPVDDKEVKKHQTTQKIEMQKDIKYLSTWLKEKSFDHQPPKQCKCFSSNWAKKGPPTELDPDAWNLICDKDNSYYSIKWPETKDLPYKNFETICRHTCGLNVSKNVPGGGNCYFFHSQKYFKIKLT